MTSGKLREVLEDIVARILVTEMLLASDEPRDPKLVAQEIIEVIHTLGFLKGIKQ